MLSRWTVEPKLDYKIKTWSLGYCHPPKISSALCDQICTLPNHIISEPSCHTFDGRGEQSVVPPLNSDRMAPFQPPGRLCQAARQISVLTLLACFGKSTLGHHKTWLITVRDLNGFQITLLRQREVRSLKNDTVSTATICYSECNKEQRTKHVLGCNLMNRYETVQA